MNYTITYVTYQAAWGGGVLLSKNTKHKMAGVERSQSITWNPHKLMGVTLQCSTVHLQEHVSFSSLQSVYAMSNFLKILHDF